MEKSLQTPLLSSAVVTGEDGPVVHKAFSTPKQYLLAAFRSLHLHVVPQITKWRHLQEPKKTATYRSRKAALLHAFIHIIPLTLGLVLVALNIHGCSIGSVSATSLTLFQFASKLLEILMQASIAAMILAFVRLQVLGSSEFPFGGLIAPFRTTEIASLWSLELWGCLTSNSIDAITRVILSIILPTAIILAALVGPSSAVLMIPRPISSLRGVQAGLWDQAELICPQSVDLQPNRTLINEPLFNKTCSDVLTNFSQTMDGSPHWGSVNDLIGSRRLQLLDWNRDFGSLNGNGLATVPSILSLGAVAADPTLTSTVFAPQPFVLMDCWISSELIDDNNRLDRYIDFGPHKSFLKEVLSLDRLTSDYFNIASQSNLTNIDDNAEMDLYYLETYANYGSFPSSNVSIAWNQLPSTTSNISLVTAMGTTSPPYHNWTISACSIEAYWAAVAANTDTTYSLCNNLPDGTENTPYNIIPNLKNPKLIALSPAWAKRNFLISADIDSSLQTDLVDVWLHQVAAYALSLSYIPDSSIFDSNTVELTIKESYTTPLNQSEITVQQYEALLGYVSSHRLVQKFDVINAFVSNLNLTDPARWILVKAQSYQDSYGYDASTITVQLSLAVVVFYLASTAGYLFITVITGNVANSWTSVAELVTLALNSKKSTDLKNMSVGIDTLETFRRPVNIRVSEDESLELVFNAAGLTGSYTQVTPNKKY